MPAPSLVSHTASVANAPVTANTANDIPPNQSNPPVLVTTNLPQLTARPGDLSTLLGSAGFKINPVGNLLITLNALFSLTKKGLTDDCTPVVAVDYAF